jgi:lysophospholipase L1-like esterase
MATTQYIGARYVPLFADPIEWDSTKTYEPLTIVYHEGNSYTSRQYVPAGKLLTDNAYWALTGNYNAQIEQYRAEVQTFDVRISKNAVDVASNATAIANEASRATAAETAIEGSKAPNDHASETAAYGVGDSVNYGHVRLATDNTPTTSGAQDGIAATPKLVNALVTDLNKKFNVLVTDLKEKLNAQIATKADRVEYAGKKLVTIGDSIMYGMGTSTPETQSLYAQIAAMLDMTVYNYAENNAGFTTNGSGTHKANYLKQLTVAHDEHPDADVIVISGGCNDATVDNDVYASAVTAFRYAHDNFPNAKVFAAPFQYGACQGNDTIANGNSGRNLKVINNISRAALATNTCLINHCWEMMVGQSQLLSDTIHPNAEGAKIQAAKIVMGMLGYDYRPTYYDLPTPGPNVNRNELTAYCIDGIVTVQGTCKTTGRVDAFKPIATLPAYANRGTSRVLGGMVGNSWSYIGMYHTGNQITTPVGIDANSDVYIGQETYPLGM